MTSRKIVYFVPPVGDNGPSPGGAGRYPLDLARGVVTRSGGRYVVELVSVARDAGSWVDAPGVTVRRLAAAGRPGDPRDAVSWQIPEAFAEADLVHIHQAYTRAAEVGLLVALQQRKPVCVTDHGETTSPLVKQLGVLDMVDRVVASSDFGASLYRTSANTTVARGGVDSTRFTPPDSPVARDRILYIGPLHPSKGVDRLIEALPPGLPLTVCGRACHDEYASRLGALAEGKTIEFVTDADEARTVDLYRRAWAVVLPSVHVDCYGNPHLAAERLGLPLLEASACGTPAVGARIGALPEFVIDGETGFLFDDPAGLAERLLTLANHPGLADRMGRRGRLRVERELDHRAAGGTLLDLYEGLIGREADSGSERAA